MATTTLLNLPVVTSLAGDEYLWLVQSGTDKRATASTIAGYGLQTYTIPATGGTARTINSKLGDFVSVKDFGAVGDGVTDDSGAIQEAINYVASLSRPTGNYGVFPNTSAGGTVYFPIGTYACANPITTPSTADIRLLGQGFMGQTIIKATAAMSELILRDSTWGSSTQLSNLTIAGNYLCNRVIWFKAGFNHVLDRCQIWGSVPLTGIDVQVGMSPRGPGLTGLCLNFNSCGGTYIGSGFEPDLTTLPSKNLLLYGVNTHICDTYTVGARDIHCHVAGGDAQLIQVHAYNSLAGSDAGDTCTSFKVDGAAADYCSLMQCLAEPPDGAIGFDVSGPGCALINNTVNLGDVAGGIGIKYSGTNGVIVGNRSLQALSTAVFIQDNSTDANTYIVGNAPNSKVFKDPRPALLFSELPAAPIAGQTAYVTDSTTAAWGAIAAGTGANKVLLWYNGTNWTVAGK